MRYFQSLLQELNLHKTNKYNYLPAMLECFDAESQRRGNCGDVLPIELLDYGCFSSIVQSTGKKFKLHFFWKKWKSSVTWLIRDYGDMLKLGGEADSASLARVRCEW